MTKLEQKQAELINHLLSLSNKNDLIFHSQKILKLESEIAKLQKEASRGKDKRNTIEDGFGSAWSIICPECGKRSMQVVRPGKCQCKYCG